ncbi:MAG: ABC transporter ATP-binding protein [Patescibacteria group bacterium]
MVSVKKKPNIFDTVKSYKLLVGLLIFAAIGVNTLNLVMPKLIANGLDAYTAGNFVMPTVAIEFSVIAIVVLILTIFQTYLQIYASEKVARDLRDRLASKISLQSSGFVQEANPSVLLTNLTSDIDAIKLFVAQAIPSIISSIVTIIGASALLLWINWKLGLAIVAIVPLIGITFFVIFSKIGPLFRKTQEAIDWLNRVINESILGSALIRVLHSEKPEMDKFMKANSEARNIGLGILKLFAAVIPAVTFISSLGIVIILGLGGKFVIAGSMSLGDFTAFMTYMAMFIFPIIILGFISNGIARSSASYARIAAVLNAPDVVPDGKIKADIKGDIEIKNVTLAGTDKPILQNISLHIKPKQKIAIIGPTAAGKTQLLYLLVGLVKPTEGNILYDGKNLAEYEPKSLHAEVGFVFQDSIMFNLTLRENIAFNTEVKNEALQKAIDTAELGDFIASLPKGLDTIVSERGTSLSGGQKQRVMLARALALNPKVLLLDDFTARVDGATEKRILENIGRNYSDLTLVSVTQKIQSIEHYDQIALLMEGEIIASGTHEALMESSPEYVQIFDSQKSTNTYESKK